MPTERVQENPIQIGNAKKQKQTQRTYPPCSPLHKVLTFLLSRSDSLQVYTLAMQVREVERQQHCCSHHHYYYHHHRCRPHLQRGHEACRKRKRSEEEQTK